MDYEVLSPWSEVDAVTPRGLLPRVADLGGKTIGLYAFAKPHGPVILEELEKLLRKRFPTAKFSHFQTPVLGNAVMFNALKGIKLSSGKTYDPEYNVAGLEILEDDSYKEQINKWLSKVDTVVTGHGD